MPDKPNLRPVEAFPAELQGQTLIALKDPQGYTEGIVLVSQEALAIMGFFDGEHTVQDIQDAFMRQHGQWVNGNQVGQLIEQLNEHHLLDGPSFEAYKAKVEQGFRRSTVRPPAHAGAAYEEQPEELRHQLDALFLAPDGPGLPDPAHQNGSLRGLIAPHIDLQRGGPTYAHAYKVLAESQPVDLFIVFGVAHTGSEHPFILTEKDFLTPLGRAETDRLFIRNIQYQCTDDLFADEISHKAEHSIEFQILFLQHFLRQQPSFRIAPILVGSFHEMVQSGMDPIEVPIIRQFVDAVKAGIEQAQSQNRRVCLIAGIDLAHIGRRFGDLVDLTPEFLQRSEQGDRVFLDHLIRRDAGALFQQIHEEKDWRKVCGFPAVYTFLQVLPDSQGCLLDYQQWADPSADCSVSFASLAYR